MSETCWLFHDWGKWSEPAISNWANPEGEHCVVQERICKRCGESHQRYVLVTGQGKAP